MAEIVRPDKKHAWFDSAVQRITHWLQKYRKSENKKWKQNLSDKL